MKLKDKLNPKVIFLTFCHLVLLNSTIGSNIAIYLSPKYAYFVPLIICAVFTLLFLFLPKLSKNYISEILKSKIYRFILVIYLLLSTIFFGYAAFKILAIKIYFMTPPFLLILFSAFFIFLLGRLNLKQILSVKILIYILVQISALIMFADTTVHDFRLLLPLNFFIDKPYKILSILFLYLDSMLYLFVPLEHKQTIAKENFIIGTFIGSLLSTWYVVYIFTAVNYKFFIDLPYPALYRYRFYAGPRYLEHLDIFFDFFLCAFFIIKSTFNLELCRVYLKAKNNYFLRLFITFGMAIGIIIFFYNTDNNIKFLFYPCIILTVLALIIYFGLWRYREHAKKSSANCHT